MAFICNKKIGCRSCSYLRYDRERNRMACFAELAPSGIILKDARIIDDDDPEDTDNLYVDKRSMP